MKMKIALIGYGKMGKTIAELAKNQQHEIILTIDADNKNDLQSEKKMDLSSMPLIFPLG